VFSSSHLIKDGVVASKPQRVSIIAALRLLHHLLRRERASAILWLQVSKAQ
jgi:hypothetical protein